VEKSDQKGIPIYLDPISRKIVTAGESDEGAITWYPSLPTSKRLWACFEIILDINGLLELCKKSQILSIFKLKFKFSKMITESKSIV
jgi:hypothetical protein